MASPPENTIKATARGFEVLLMPYDALRYMANVQTPALGDPKSDYGAEAIFLTLEVANAEEIAQGKEKSSLSITYPASKASVGRLKYTELQKCVVYYRCGEGEEDASVWLLTSSLPQFELKSKIANSPWRLVKMNEQAENGERRDALYMRCAKGRQINPDFFTKCALGNLLCGDLGVQTPDSFDPDGKLRRGVIANDFLIRVDSETLVKYLKDPNRKRKKRMEYEQPSAEAVLGIGNLPEESKPPDLLGPGPELDERKPPVVTVDPPVPSPGNEVLLSIAPQSEPGPNLGIPAANFHLLDDPRTGLPSCPVMSPLSGPVIPGWPISNSEILISLDEDLIGFEEPEKDFWISILFDELGPGRTKKENPAPPSCWLDILRAEFGENKKPG
ncbi:hypothetical protein TWF481_003651 [Arthrobotrys musiformis]|uniref:Uncharacterized protein n=1 Tax=Arthrobotrys musiformis TaxID=47236 RepID=A0AAV9WJ78_9PEZI